MSVTKDSLPRTARIDAPGLLHHVWQRGVEKREIFLNDEDRKIFLARLELLCEEHGAVVYAWCLMSNHFHLAIRSGHKPLSKTMSGLLTSYAMRFNKVHGRSGYLFQNRYKSTIIDEERYFLSLVRYIHLNPLRARIVSNMDALAIYPWTGHCALMGNDDYGFQDVDGVLLRFAKRAGIARRHLIQFMVKKEAKNDEEVFTGGGLIRSMGGVHNLREHLKNKKYLYDERILGDGAFVEAVLKEAKSDRKSAIIPEEKRWKKLEQIQSNLCRQFEVKEAELLGGSRRRPVSEVRRLIAYAGQKQLGLSSTQIAKHLGVSCQNILKGITKAEEEWQTLDWIGEGIE